MRTIAIYILLVFPLWVFSQSGDSPEKYTRYWGTYFGDSGSSQGIPKVTVINESVVDENGNLWIAGRIDEYVTPTMDTIVTADAYQAEYGGGSRDGFLAKFSPEGELLYATYFGGEGQDVINSIDVSGNKVYVVGVTTSENGIATPGAYQEEVKSGFIVQMDTLGQVNWGTYYNARPAQIKTGKENDFYFWGMTPYNGMGTLGAFRESIPPPYLDGDGEYQYPAYPILARFDDTGSLKWATYYAPDINEVTNYEISAYNISGGLAVDGDNNVYVSGISNDTEGYYGVPGAHQSMVNGEDDIFVTRFSPTGERDWSTYFGGEYPEANSNIQILVGNILLLSGLTMSETGISTPGAWQASLGTGFSKGFVTRLSLDQNGQQLWGTYTFETHGPQYMNVDSYGSIFVYTNMSAMDGLSTLGCYQEENAGEYDNILAKFNDTGTELLFFSYYGGNQDEYISWNNMLSISEDDEIYITGQTGSTNNMLSENAFQTEYLGSKMGLIAKFIPCPGAVVPTGDAEQEFLSEDTLDNLEVNFTDWSGSELIVTWYADAEGAEVLPPETVLEDGQTYYVSQQIQGCDESGLLAITVTETMGVADQTFANLELYPNPNKGKFTLSGLPGDAVQVGLYDIRGREVYSNDFGKAKSIQIDLKGQLRTGIYFLEVSTLGATDVIRVLVK